MSRNIVTLPDPMFMDWPNWAEVVSGYNPDLVGELDPDEDWTDFANRFCQIIPEAPQAEGFTAWQDWAMATKQALGV